MATKRIKIGHPYWHVLIKAPVVPLDTVDGTEYVDCVHYQVNADGEIEPSMRRIHSINIANPMNRVDFTT